MEPPDVQSLLALIPFARTLGMELLEASPDQVRARLAWTPERTTTAQTLHGGAIMALADNCGGICAYLNLPPGGEGTATIESKTNFVRPIPSGAANALTRPLHRGRTLMVLETEITRDDGKLAAKVTQTQIFS